MQETAVRSTGIQALRAFACFAVFAQHFLYYLYQARGLDYSKAVRLDTGALGVSIFFVISGYVIVNCLSQRERFLANRVLRILPPYWLAIAASFLLLAGWMPGWTFTWPSAFLLPQAALNQTLYIPYWTLVFESLFYALMTPLAVMPTLAARKNFLLNAWLAIIILMEFLHPDLSALWPGFTMLLSPINVFFIAGAMLAIHGNSVGRAPKGILFAVAVVTWCIAHSVTFGTQSAKIALQAIAYSAALLFVMQLRFPRFVVRLGDASYGIYLVHVIAILASIELLTGFGIPATAHRFWILVLALALAASILFGLFEYHMHQRWLKPLLRRLLEHTAALRRT